MPDNNSGTFMSRPAKNQLTIEPVFALDSGGKPTNQLLTYRMFGHVFGEKIRRRSLDLVALEKEKQTLLNTVEDKLAMERPREALTFLTADHLREAENLFREFRGLPRPMAEYVRAGVAALGNGARVLVADARTAWEKKMTSVLVQISERTRMANLNNLDHFITHSKCAYLDEITPEKIRLFLERDLKGQKRAQAKTQTRLSHALRLQAFINFCLAESLLASSPFKMKMDSMVKLAKQERERPRILKPDQAAALLDATLEICPEMVPFILLGTWCFIRDAEIARLVPADVYLDTKTPHVQLTGEKFGSSMRDVEIPANVLPLLRQCLKRGLWAKDANPFFSVAYFKQIRERAGLIKLGPRGNGGNQLVLTEGNHWQSHIMRHTGISYHFNRHGNINETTRQAGNSPVTAFAHYLKLPHEGDAEAFYAITRILKNSLAQETAQAVA